MSSHLCYTTVDTVFFSINPKKLHQVHLMNESMNTVIEFSLLIMDDTFHLYELL